MPPVAKRQISYEDGSPQQVFQAAIDRKFPTHKAFIDQVARKVGNTWDSANGTYYGFMRGGRSLPLTHKRAYIKLTGVDGSVLDEIEAQRQPRRGRRGPEPWLAKGRLKPLWQKLPASGGRSEPRRDDLAEISGINDSVLSSINTGKRAMTVEHAEAIIKAMREEVGLEVTFEDLGRPPGWLDDETFARRLGALEAQALRTRTDQRELAQGLTALEERIVKLESQRRAAPAETKRPRTRRSTS